MQEALRQAAEAEERQKAEQAASEQAAADLGLLRRVGHALLHTFLSIGSR